jgi:anti-anti-sigma regulatory factor
MRRIDLKDVLARTVSSVYGDLVTRRTGEAVRSGIEAMLSEDDETAVIDFGTVRLMDMSCADEIVGKLLLAHGPGRYFLLVGVHAAHEDALLPVLERHHLVVVAQDRAGALKVLGSLPEPARRAFGYLADSGPAEPDEIAARLALAPDVTRDALQTLCERRVVRERGGHYQTLRSA